MKKTLHALTALAAAFALTLTACQAQPAAAVDTAQPAPLVPGRRKRARTGPRGGEPYPDRLFLGA